MCEIFPSKKENLDWQLIAEIEPMVVSMGATEELQKLKQVKESIAFCTLENEFNKVGLINWSV